MLFTTNTFGPGSGMPQNYYVMTEKYEWLDLTKWENTITNSPGVYYYLTMEPGKNKSDYVDSNGILYPSYMSEKYLVKEEDIHINENALYFRKVVELVLSSAENVVNIADATRIKVQALEPNLYQKFNENGEEGYRSVSALSDIFVGKVNYGSIGGLC